MLSSVYREGATWALRPGPPVEAFPRAKHLAGEGDPVQGFFPVSPSSLRGLDSYPSCLSEVLLPQVLIPCLPVVLPVNQARGSSSQAVLGHLSRMCSGLLRQEASRCPVLPVFPFQRSFRCQT